MTTREPPAPAGALSGRFWRCVAYCQEPTCGKEIGRAEHVPESERWRVNLSAPLNAICDVPGHSTFSDCNFAPRLEWTVEEEGS